MMYEAQSARDILASFIADAAAGKHGDDAALEAILLEHVLLQGGFKILAREPEQRILLAGVRTSAPDEIWREMWDAAGIYHAAGDENYTPA
jgi:hypothetical protein